MQTVETLNEGLKRTYTLTIPASEIAARVDAEIKRVAPQVKMPGFRPGKVPANLVRKMHGPALLQDALNSSIQQGVQALLADKQLRPATQPSVELGEGYEAGRDAEVKVALEVLPTVPTPAITGLKLERLTVPAEEAKVDEQLRTFAEQGNSFEAYPEGHAAADGDVVVMDFVGKTADGVAFAGGTGTGMKVKLGSGSLIPGFEEQMIGVKAGDEKQIAVTFPADYQAKELAGQPATFDLVITAVNDPSKPAIGEDLAKGLGLESLEQLRGLLKAQVEEELNGLTRTYMKRKLLDQLAEGHDFEVPPSMVDAEFQQIWAQLEHETEHEPDPAAAKAEMEGERDDYRRIAERRVRLGLLLSEIGAANGIEVSQQETQRLVAQAAQQYRPEDRQRFAEYIASDPMAAAQLRAPLYEDKVVDFLFGTAEITDREVTREELEAAIESEDGFASGTHVHTHDHDHDHAGHDHDHADHDHGAHDHAAPDHAPEEPVAGAAPVKKPRAKKAAAPVAAETQVLEASPIAAEQAEGVEAADAPVKKPRAKKAKAAEA